MLRIFNFIFLFISFNASAVEDSVTHFDRLKEGKNLLLVDEKFVEALKFFTKDLQQISDSRRKVEIAEDMYWISECLFQLRKIKQLEHVLKVSEEFMKRERQDSMYNWLMLTKSKYLIDIGNSKEALKLLLRFDSYNKSANFIIEKKLIIADAYYRISELDISKEIYDYVIKNAIDSSQIAQAYNGIGSYYFMNSEFDSARKYFNLSIKMYTNIYMDINIKTASVIYNLSLISDKYGDYYTENRFIDELIYIFENKNILFHPQIAELYGTKGNIFTIQDDLGKSFFYYIKEKRILQSIYLDDNPRLINIYSNFAELNIIKSNFYLAEIEILNAIDLTKKFYSKKHNLYTQCIVKYSEILIEKKDYRKADSLLKDVIRINQINPNDYLPDAYYLLGCNYLAQKKYDQAILYFHKADQLYVHFFGNKNVYSIDPLTSLSNTYLQMNNSQQALNFANLALNHTIDINRVVFPYDHWECILQILKCKKDIYLQHNQTEVNIKNEIELIKSTIAEASKIKQSYYSNGSQMHYNEKMSELNVLGIFFLTHLYKKADDYFFDNLLFFSENNKANLLRYKISTNESNELLPEVERDKLATITDRLNYFISLNENQEDANFNINDSILRYQTLHETYTKNIEQKYPKIYNIKYGQKPISLKEIQSKLEKDFSFLVYCNDGENYYCINISKQKINYRICGSKNIIDSIIHQYQNKLQDKEFDIKNNLLISNLLLPKELKPNLIILPDDKIQFISFDALYKMPTKQYLIYNHTVQYAFSAGTYFNHSEVSANKNIIGFFPSFENSKYATLNNSEEKNTLQKINTFIQFSDTSATKELFLKNYKKAGVIHIASHLIADSISPLESHILFQKNKGNKLTINEIWKLNSNMQLVSMAACKSNFGASQTGEGNLNFAWAFHYAGAHNVLSTQWNASDKSTSTITSYFYKFLANGKSKEEALQLAKINYLKSTDAIGAQPFFWANYCLYADNTKINISHSLLYYSCICLLIIMLISIVMLVFYKKVVSKKSIFVLC